MKDKIKILIVDDDPDILNISEKALKPEGYNVEYAPGAEEAIQMIEKIDYDLVLTDLEMPGADSIALIKRIKQSRPATGIVALTEYRLHEPIKEAHKLGIIGHVRKPFTSKDLKDVINKTIAWSSANFPEETPKAEFAPSLIAELDKMIKLYRKKPVSTLTMLLRAQEIFGYLHPEIQKRIAHGLDMYPSEIHSVVSSYSCFRVKPAADRKTGLLKGSERPSWGIMPKTGRKVTNAVNEFIKWRGQQPEEKAVKADTVSILVADNDPDSLRSFQNALVPEGYKVDGAIRIEDTIPMIKQNNYSLVFIDLSITGKEAISLIRDIRKFRPDISIVVITKHLFPETIKEGYLLGINDHMMKPFTFSIIKATTARAIKQLEGKALRYEQKKDIPFSLIAEFDKAIQQYTGNSIKIIPLLLRAQQIFGCLTSEIQEHIARRLRIYPSEIQSIVSSYSFFKKKEGEVHAPGYLRGGEKVWRGLIPKSDKNALSAVNEFIRWRQTEFRR